jgi:Protein of unknown function (DUF1592)/Protein of unknown function (DUF1588)/Protein of unknown function (DUF1595)/Protein of unknown function (DUF1585)/Protein of unknown function (DUF1587)
MKSLVGQRPKLALAIFLAPMLAASCTGNVSGGVPGSGSGATSGPASGGGGSGAGPTGGAVGPVGVIVVGPTAKPVAESAGPLVLRRLTHREFNHTLQDLLGDTTNPADTWSVDDGSTNSGFEAPNSVDKTTLQFIEPSIDAAAESAVAQNRVTIPCTNPAVGAAETTCATQFINTFGRRAYRRPVTDLERADLLTVFNAAHGAPISYDFKTSIAQVIKAMLQSPNFLYHHWELGPAKPTRQGNLVNLTQYQIASRLSYLLWESMPDDALLNAADMGMLSTPDQIATQAQRLMADKVRTANSLYNFHVQWLQYPNLGQVAKNTQRYPVFTEAFNASLEPEIAAFVSSVMLGGDGTLKTLLTAPYAFANASTAPVYGKTVTGTAMQRIDLDPTQRAGILTQSAFLSTAAEPGRSHPIRRGLIVYEQLLCGTVPAFNGVLPLVPEADGVNIVTTRQAYSAHDKMPCATCHVAFDGIGYSFENYDAVGTYRTKDNGQDVDATGALTTPILKTPFSFKNGVELANFLATNDEVKSCVTRQWFRYLLGRLEVSADEGSLQAAAKQAAANPAFSVPDLLVGMVKSTAFRMRLPGAGESI